MKQNHFLPSLCDSGVESELQRGDFWDLFFSDHTWRIKWPCSSCVWNIIISPFPNRNTKIVDNASDPDLTWRTCEGSVWCSFTLATKYSMCGWHCFTFNALHCWSFIGRVWFAQCSIQTTTKFHLARQWSIYAGPYICLSSMSIFFYACLSTI